jgi:hypothetical protein
VLLPGLGLDGDKVCTVRGPVELAAIAVVGSAVSGKFRTPDALLIISAKSGLGCDTVLRQKEV